MRYLLNSAVITAFGTWDYQPIRPAAARAWLHEEVDGDVARIESTIRYEETARALEILLEKAPGSLPVRNQTITMQPGDEALVFRLVFPSGVRPEAVSKGALGLAYIQKHSELGLLRRLT